jgi:hypothetical protein
MRTEPTHLVNIASKSLARTPLILQIRQNRAISPRFASSLLILAILLTVSLPQLLLTRIIPSLTLTRPHMCTNFSLLPQPTVRSNTHTLKPNSLVTPALQKLPSRELIRHSTSSGIQIFLQSNQHLKLRMLQLQPQVSPNMARTRLQLTVTLGHSPLTTLAVMLLSQRFKLRLKLTPYPPLTTTAALKLFGLMLL